MGYPDCGSLGKDFLEQKSLLRRKISGMSPECFCDTTLPSDIGICGSAELQEGINDKADDMEAVSHYFSIGEKPLYKATEGRA